ncbi:MAG: T9SS type A sorting domain-containing protein [Ignavibacteria bacterium]|nr:T9SS type A sorting domain-containing protein [Ignavibacteria bacterium]
MKTVIKILVIVLFVSLINDVNAQFKIKAKDKFTQAQTSANNVSPDAMLYAIISTAALDTTGKDLSWIYNYYSANLDTGIIVITSFIGALPGTIGPTLPGSLVRLLTNNFVDSDVALTTAENAGGRLFRQAHPNYNIFATIFKVPGLPDTTRPYWTVLYSDSTDNEIFIIDGITGQIVPIGITNISSEVPDKYVLYQNYPNPFNPSTSIRFDISKMSNVKITVYDVLGRELTGLIEKDLNAGSYVVNWNAANYPSGVYFYKLETEDFFDVKRMVLIK